MRYAETASFLSRTDGSKGSDDSERPGQRPRVTLANPIHTANGREQLDLTMRFAVIGAGLAGTSFLCQLNEKLQHASSDAAFNSTALELQVFERQAEVERLRARRHAPRRWNRPQRIDDMTPPEHQD